MPNPYVRAIDFSTGAAVVKCANGQQFTFPIQGFVAGTSAPPVVIDASAAVAALKVDVDARFDAVLAAVKAIGTGGVTPVPPTSDFFPADPGIAPFPSPENSQILVLGDEISGRPYLKDKNGGLHQIKKDAAGVPKYYVGGQLIDVWPGEFVAQCLVRQGMVYMQIAGGIWKQVAANGSMYNTALPVAYTSGSPGTIPLPPLPPMPVASAITPGSSGRVINCGKGTTLPTIAAGIAAAQPGDTVQIATGTYNEPIPTITVPIILDGGGGTFSGKGLTGQLAGGGKGLIVPRADCIVRNFGLISDVAMDQTEGQLTSAIRSDDGCGYLTVLNVNAHNNQCAIGSGGYNVVIIATDCDISGNGLLANSGSLTHNLYVGQACRRLTLTRVISNGSNEAHAIKYRGPELIVDGGTFMAVHGSCFDLPNGSTVQAKISGATIIKPAGADDHKVLNYAEEGQDNGLAGMLISGGAIQALCDNPAFNGSGGTIMVTGVTVSGNKINATGGVVVSGLPA